MLWNRNFSISGIPRVWTYLAINYVVKEMLMIWLKKEYLYIYISLKSLNIHLYILSFRDTNSTLLDHTPFPNEEIEQIILLLVPKVGVSNLSSHPRFATYPTSTLGSQRSAFFILIWQRMSGVPSNDMFVSWF